tara:strand:- start:273 stop:995 length:723 start_codon:yes stop_codon:yes gene_type:complete
MSIGDLFPPEGMQSAPPSMSVGGNAVPVTRSSLEELQSVVEGKDVYNDYKKLEELTNLINLEEDAVNTGKKTPDDLKSLRLQMDNLQDFILGKYGSRARFQTLLVNAFPSEPVPPTAVMSVPPTAVMSVPPEVLAKDAGILSLKKPVDGGIGAYAAEPKEGSVSPVTMPKRPESRAQVRSPRPIRAPGGAPLNNRYYLDVPEYTKRPPYFDFNPSAGADFTQQLLARAAEEKAGGFSNLV